MSERYPLPSSVEAFNRADDRARDWNYRQDEVRWSYAKARQAIYDLVSLHKEMARKLEQFESSADSAYDRAVTSRTPECCSCHISPPCSYCVGMTEEEVDARCGAS